jgi:hypothetical protein
MCSRNAVGCCICATRDGMRLLWLPTAQFCAALRSLLVCICSTGAAQFCAVAAGSQACCDQSGGEAQRHVALLCVVRTIESCKQCVLPLPSASSGLLDERSFCFSVPNVGRCCYRAAFSARVTLCAHLAKHRVCCTAICVSSTACCASWQCRLEHIIGQLAMVRWGWHWVHCCYRQAGIDSAGGVERRGLDDMDSLLVLSISCLWFFSILCWISDSVIVRKV